MRRARGGSGSPAASSTGRGASCRSGTSARSRSARSSSRAPARHPAGTRRARRRSAPPRRARATSASAGASSRLTRPPPCAAPRAAAADGGSPSSAATSRPRRVDREQRRERVTPSARCAARRPRPLSIGRIGVGAADRAALRERDHARAPPWQSRRRAAATWRSRRNRASRTRPAAACRAATRASCRASGVSGSSGGGAAAARDRDAQVGLEQRGRRPAPRCARSRDRSHRARRSRAGRVTPNAWRTPRVSCTSA